MSTSIKSFLSSLNLSAVLPSLTADSEEIRTLRYADEQIQKTLEALNAGDLAQAKRCADEAEKQMVRYRREGGIANVVMRRGQIDFTEGRYEEAKAKFLQASAHYQKLNEDLGQANCLALLGHYYQQIKEYDIAREMFAEAVMVYKQINALPSRQNTVTAYLQCFYASINHLIEQKSYEQAADLKYHCLGHCSQRKPFRI